METRTCKTCESAVVGVYCPHCGQRHRERRITMRSIAIELFQLLTNLERGLWHTILGLVRDPGKVIRDYLEGATVLYFQPFRFLLLTAGISALVSSFVDFDKVVEMATNMGGVEMTPEAKAIQTKTVHSLLRYTTALISLSVPLSSIGTYLAYRKFRSTYAEHMVANAYLYGLLSLLSIVTIWFTTQPSTFMPVTLLSYAAMLFGNSWFYKKWYGLKWAQAFWRSLLAIFITLFTVIFVGNIVTIVLIITGVMPRTG